MERRAFVPLCQPSLALWSEAPMVCDGTTGPCWAGPVEQGGRGAGSRDPGGEPGEQSPAPRSTTKPSGPRVGSSRFSICRRRRPLPRCPEGRWRGRVTPPESRGAGVPAEPQSWRRRCSRAPEPEPSPLASAGAPTGTRCSDHPGSWPQLGRPRRGSTPSTPHSPAPPAAARLHCA